MADLIDGPTTSLPSSSANLAQRFRVARTALDVLSGLHAYAHKYWHKQSILYINFKSVLAFQD
jgi:hypothetical protein